MNILFSNTSIVEITLKTLLEFLVELYILYFLFTFKLKRKSHFWARFLVGFLCLVVISFGVAVFYKHFGNTVWGRTVVYTFLFALSILHIRFCFNESVWTVLFCCSISYAAQNLMYKGFLVIWCAGLQHGIFPFKVHLSELYYRIMYYGILAIEMLILYLIFVRRTRKRFSYRSQNVRVIAGSILILGITVLLCSFEDVYFGMLSTTQENLYDNIVYYILRQSGNIFSIICCVSILMLLSTLQEKYDLKQDIQYLQHTMKEREAQYQISKETIDLINLKCHDMRHKITTMLVKDSELPSEVISELEETISIYDANIKTGNSMLDVILTEKSLFCEKNNIHLSCMIHGEALSFLGESDLCSLFGNIVDNAIDAVKDLDTQQRIINLLVKIKDGVLIVQTENYFKGDIQFEDGLPVTKRNQNYHGFGMKSIESIVRKYNGEMTAYVENNVFHLNILFFI